MEEQFEDIKKIIKESGVDTPSADFMHKVMKEIVVVSGENSQVYQPLISKNAWVVLSFGFIIFIAALTFLYDSDTSIFDLYSLSVFKPDSIDFAFSGFKFHQTTTYGVLFLALLFLIQVTVIKRGLDKDV
ncbi:hypothetical protein [Aquimarina sp. RZ0]|uniref:hypothetical protein n=1 Tax=Aquimarina sp. RZ0 TaxID=2607730 RepID=UPI0011F1DFC9|nr:hypothetical protein [Aquimarina sp. RZ0]KAA1246663.1 hypothetical protein F0000_06370 [Aquimarina sp. RZ0]